MEHAIFPRISGYRVMHIDYCKPGPLKIRTVAHRQIDDTVCMQAGYTASVIPDGVIEV